MRHSQSDIGKAVRRLGFAPTRRIGDGLELAIPWYMRQQECVRRIGVDFDLAEPPEAITLRMTSYFGGGKISRLG